MVMCLGLWVSGSAARNYSAFVVGELNVQSNELMNSTCHGLVRFDI